MSSFFPIQIDNLDKASFLRDPFTMNILPYFETFFADNSELHFLTKELETLSLDISNVFGAVTQVSNHKMPQVLSLLIQENLEELTLLYELVFVSNLNVNNYGEHSYTSRIEDVLSKLNSSHDSNSKYTAQHIQKIAENFFPGEDNLALSTFDLSQNISFKAFFPNVGIGFINASDLYKYWNSPIKNISEMKFYVESSPHKVKFDMVNHPFVFAINCAFLHKKIFVLSFDTESHITFMSSEINKAKLDYEDKFAHVKAILTGELTMNDYIHDFIMNNHRLFQRDKIKTAQILSAIHIEAQKQMWATINCMWDNFVSRKINQYIMDTAVKIEEENSKVVLRENYDSVFGWS